MEVTQIIQELNKTSGIKNPVYYYLNGGCYIFAKQLQQIIGGAIYYLLLEHHFVVEINNKFYDASGNVTKKYKDCKKIAEEEFQKRIKLKKSIKH